MNAALISHGTVGDQKTLFNPGGGGFAASVHLKQHWKSNKMSQELQLREVVFTCYKSVKVTHNIAIDRKLQACSLHIYSEIRTAKHANNVTTQTQMTFTKRSNFNITWMIVVHNTDHIIINRKCLSRQLAFQSHRFFIGHVEQHGSYGQGKSGKVMENY